MGVEVVDHRFRRHDLEKHYPNIECDIAQAKLIHEMDPTQNYILCEMRFPALEKFMPKEDYDLIEDTYHYDCMHRMKYIEVTNKEFYTFMNGEGAIFENERRGNSEATNTYDQYPDRKGINVVRSEHGDKVVTHYFSADRMLGLLRHDYYMGLILYMNNPPRNYVRRTPCKKLDPECNDCPETLKEEVNGWLEDAPEFYPNIEKTFFTYIEENHRLLMGYTEDMHPEKMSGNQYVEPKYFILDMNVKYFEDVIYSKIKWQKTILDNRRNYKELLYSFSRVTENKDENEIVTIRDEWKDYGNNMPLAQYRFSEPETVPIDIWRAVTMNDFTALWDADLIRYNARNTAHKWSFNHWSNLGSYVSDGFFCGWSTTEIIEAGATASGGGEDITQQASQALGAIGWGDGAPGSTDSVFTLLEPKLPGYEYEDYIEPLPVREF